MLRQEWGLSVGHKNQVSQRIFPGGSVFSYPRALQQRLYVKFMLKDKGILDTKKLRQVKSFGKKQKTKTPLIIKILGMVLERF